MLRTTTALSLIMLLAACGGGNSSQPSDTAAPLVDMADGTGTVSPQQAAATPLPKADPELVAFYKTLHAAPELSFKEANTSAILATELTQLGFEVTTGLGQDWVVEKATRDIGTVHDGVGGYGVVGVLKNGDGPTIMIRTDMDALPVAEQTDFEFASTVKGQTWTGVDNGVMHACGHDIHMTSWVGTARQLVAQKNEWSGTLIMLAQPAEELGNGAVAMLSDGLYQNFPLPDYNLALHVSAGAKAGTVAYSPGFGLANVDSVDITVKGVGGHGAYPHTTTDPILISAHIVTALQSLVSRNVDPQTPGVVTVGSIKAGAKHNIIPNEAELLLTVRSYDDETRTLLLDGIKRIAEGQAASFGAPAPLVTVDPDYTPATYNDPELTAKAMAAIGAAIGEGNVQEVKPTMGGEDFGQYSRTAEKVPSLIYWVGAVNPDKFDVLAADGENPPSLHSAIFAPDYDPTIATGVKAMTAAALDLFKSK